MRPTSSEREGVVSPEAVPLEFSTAGIGSRFVARLLDSLIQGVTLVALALAAGLVVGEGGSPLPPAVAVSLVVFFVFAIIWGYPAGFETLWRGRTPGKAAAGLRVVTVEGAPVQFRHAALRAMLGIVELSLLSGLPAVIAVLATRRNQRLGDLVAGTVVLRERTGLASAEPARFAVPAGAESYAVTLDTATVRAQDYATVRSFLLRAPQLAPAARGDVARRLAQPLAARMHHQPPDWVDPELFLACVAARYQRRGDVAAVPPAQRPPPPTAQDSAGFAPPR